MSDELVAWLKARLDEDEQLASAASPGPWRPNAEHDEVVAVDDITVAEGFALSNNQLRRTVDHIARHDPARVLAEVAAKRRIIDRHGERVLLDEEGNEEPDPMSCGQCMDAWPCADVRDLASAYAGREGFRAEWAPDEEVSR